MATTQGPVVIGAFDNRDQASRAVEELRRAGFREDQIGFVGPKGGPDSGDTYAEEGAATGAVAGGVLGGLAGAVAAGLIPGVGPVIAAGILAATVGGAAAGAAAGGLLGGLIGLGIPEEEARYYEGEFRSGRTLVTVRAGGRADEARVILRRHGGYERSDNRAAARTGTARDATAGGQTMKVHEEELQARKQPVQTGEVRVHKEVVTEHQALDVPVRREEVVVERRPASGQPAPGTDIRAGEEIRVPVTEEQVHVEKQPVVKEEVHVGKRQVQDTKHVSGTVRKEQVRVERSGSTRTRDGQ